MLTCFLVKWKNSTFPSSPGDVGHSLIEKNGGEELRVYIATAQGISRNLNVYRHHGAIGVYHHSRRQVLRQYIEMFQVFNADGTIVCRFRAWRSGERDECDGYRKKVQKKNRIKAKCLKKVCTMMQTSKVP